MRFSTKVFVGFLTLGAVLAFLIGLERRKQPPPATASTKQDLKPSKNLPDNGTDWFLGDAESRKRNLEAFQRFFTIALSSGDEARWGSMLQDLTNEYSYRREESIDILIPLLRHENVAVRVAAGKRLLELGSYAGVPLLQSMVAAYAGGESLNEKTIIDVVGTLRSFRQYIDVRLLWESYRRSQSAEWFKIMALCQVPEMRNVVVQMRHNSPSGSDYDCEWDAAILGMKDSDSIERYRGLLRQDGRSQVLGHWALYQALNDPVDFEYLTSVCRKAAGIGVREGAAGLSSDAADLAYQLLHITMTPEAQKAKEEIIAHLSGVNSGNIGYYATCLRSLFYLHKDYGFVDQIVLDHLLRVRDGRATDKDLIMRIAAARGTSEIQAAAKAFSAAGFERYFIMLAGRPVEAWAFDYRIVPISVAPALPTETMGPVQPSK